MIGLIASLVLVWVIRVAHLIGNWPYAIISLAILAIAPNVGAAVHARRTAAARVAAAGGAALPAGAAATGGDGLRGGLCRRRRRRSTRGDGVLAGVAAERRSRPRRQRQRPPAQRSAEWLGITQPFQPEDVALMDEVLGLPVLPEVAPHGAA